ncbi:antirestriction protein [Salmonella enterica]|nr:antirestriction protein [Salmonella enterica]ELM1533942.1 antirestriction protein [Salmonella enterica]
MNTIMLNSSADLTQATIKLFGSFAPYVPEVIQEYVAEYVFNYRHKGFAIREMENGQGYFLPLHIERISMITPIERNLHDVSPDALGILMTLHCYSICAQSDVQHLSDEAKSHAREQIEIIKNKRKILLNYALKTLSPDDIVMLLK